MFSCSGTHVLPRSGLIEYWHPLDNLNQGSQFRELRVVTSILPLHIINIRCRRRTIRVPPCCTVCRFIRLVSHHTGRRSQLCRYQQGKLVMLQCMGSMSLSAPIDYCDITIAKIPCLVMLERKFGLYTRSDLSISMLVTMFNTTVEFLPSAVVGRFRGGRAWRRYEGQVGWTRPGQLLGPFLPLDRYNKIIHLNLSMVLNASDN